MNPRVLRRFVVLMICLVVAVTFIWPLLEGYVERPPGDYYTEVGSNRLQEGAFEEALKHFDLALAEAPNHRGALMGRAIVFTQTDRPDEAVAEYTHLIGYLKKALPENDKTGRAVLAAAYANRGIVHDRAGRYKKALDDYARAIRTDEGAVDEPGVIHKILYGNSYPSSVRKRAQYIYEQLQKPAGERLMRVPEIDAKQRMFKP
jgi:tetratricopeptide (TPR) repeat protein